MVGRRTVFVLWVAISENVTTSISQVKMMFVFHLLLLVLWYSLSPWV